VCGRDLALYGPLCSCWSAFSRSAFFGSRLYSLHTTSRDILKRSCEKKTMIDIALTSTTCNSTSLCQEYILILVWLNTSFPWIAVVTVVASPPDWGLLWSRVREAHVTHLTGTTAEVSWVWSFVPLYTIAFRLHSLPFSQLCSEFHSGREIDLPPFSCTLQGACLRIKCQLGVLFEQGNRSQATYLHL
jgi:hypothetical protein